MRECAYRDCMVHDILTDVCIGQYAIRMCVFVLQCYRLIAIRIIIGVRLVGRMCNVICVPILPVGNIHTLIINIRHTIQHVRINSNRLIVRFRLVIILCNTRTHNIRISYILNISRCLSNSLNSRMIFGLIISLTTSIRGSRTISRPYLNTSHS